MKRRKSTGQKKVFQKIGIERGLYSELSGQPVQGVPSNFAHILRKGKFPEAMLDEENIVILTPEEHNIFDNDIWKMEGDDRWKWILHKKEQLLKKYLKPQPKFV